MTAIPVHYITYYYPPKARARSRLYFSRYLAEAGFDVNVITSGDWQGTTGAGTLDFSAEIPHGVKVEYISDRACGTLPLVLYHMNLIPCPFLSWGIRSYKFLLRAGVKPGWILATYPPMADVAAALLLHNKTGLPLALDFRDDLLEGYALRLMGPRMFINRRLIAEALSKASLVSVATPYIASSLKRHYRFRHDKLVVVLNGYGDSYEVPQQTRDKGKISIVYAGAATPAQTPELLIHAVRRLRVRYPELADKLSIKYFCPPSLHFKKHIQELFGGSVQYGGFLPFMEIQQEMMAADILFLSLSGSEYAYAFPGKLADYVNMEKPILAALPKGFARELIEGNGLGIAVDTGDVEALSDALAHMVSHPEELKGYEQAVTAVKESFAMKHQVNLLAQRLKENFPIRP